MAVSDTQELTIQTASVDVKILRVGKKQMTLSVFRQLPKEDLLAGYSRPRRISGRAEDEDFELHERGTPWGIVRYFWESDDPFVRSVEADWACFRERIQVVWEEEGRLSRSLVMPCLVPRPLLHYKHRGLSTISKDDLLKFEPRWVGDKVGCHWFSAIWRGIEREVGIEEIQSDLLAYEEAYRRWFYDRVMQLSQLFIAV